MPAYVTESIRRILSAAVHLWITSGYCETEQGEVKTIPGWTTYYFYSRDIGWGNNLLKGSRIKVEIEVEDNPDA